MFTDLALKIWWNTVKTVMEEKKETVHLLSDEERGSLLGVLQRSFDIPLQTVSKQFEKRIR